MKQQKNRQCSGCDRYFSPEGLKAHQSHDANTGYNACEFYARYVKHQRQNVIITERDEMERRVR